MKDKAIKISTQAMVWLSALAPQRVWAQATDEVCEQIGDDIGGCDPNALFGEGGIVHRISETLIFIVGAVSVIVLIIAGLMYVLSAGNPEQTKRAKDAIIYAAIGLAVSVLSFAIVNFVLVRLGG